MEGIVFDAPIFDSTVAFLCGVAILAIEIAVILIGSVYDKEARGEKVFWAEWPLPEAGHEAPAEEERKAPRAA